MVPFLNADVQPGVGAGPAVDSVAGQPSSAEGAIAFSQFMAEPAVAARPIEGGEPGGDTRETLTVLADSETPDWPGAVDATPKQQVNASQSAPASDAVLLTATEGSLRSQGQDGQAVAAPHRGHLPARPAVAPEDVQRHQSALPADERSPRMAQSLAGGSDLSPQSRIEASLGKQLAEGEVSPSQTTKSADVQKPLPTAEAPQRQLAFSESFQKQGMVNRQQALDTPPKDASARNLTPKRTAQPEGGDTIDTASKAASTALPRTVFVEVAGSGEKPLPPVEALFGQQGLSAERTATTQGAQSASPQANPQTEAARHVASQLAMAVTQSQGKPTEIALNPEELGRVRLSLSAVDASLTLTVFAERIETSDLMRRHIDVLAQEFRDLGYENINFNFTDQQDDAQEQKGAGPSDQELIQSASEDADMGVGPAIAASGIDIRL